MSNDEFRAAYVEAYNSGDAAGVGKFYAEDAVDLPPGGGRLAGRTAIEASVADQHKQGWGELSLEPVESTGFGELTVESGTYTISRGSGIESGHYLFLMKKGPDGQPLIVRTMAN